MTQSPKHPAAQRPTMATFDQLDSFYESVAGAIVDVIEDAVSERGVARISLSGGSTPKRLYERLAQRDLPWSKIHWFWGDERNVPKDHPDSNQRMVREAMLEPAKVAESNIHPVPVDVQSPASTATRYEQTLREHFSGNAFPKWDLMLLGMGDDAHTASLFPHTQALHEPSRWFVENWVPKLDAFRYTLTVPAINSARECWFLVAGSGKRNALHQVWDGAKDSDEYPSQLVQPSRWFVTADADPRNAND